MKEILQNQSNISVTGWLTHIHYMRSSKISYWVHKTQDSNEQWLLTNFNYNITNHCLKTKDLTTAKKRAKIIIDSKRNFINVAIKKLASFSKKINPAFIHANHLISQEIIAFTEKMK